MIPKVIHYCWFGGKPLSQLSEQCIASWKRFCPDYEIIRWDERSYDVNQNAYTQEAHAAGKWAFVSDYARLDILYRHGGIYLDTDVELLRPLDSLCAEPAFLVIEYTLLVNTGLGMGGEAGNVLFHTLRDAYDAMTFHRPDGTLDMTPCSYHQTRLLEERGFLRRDERQTVDGVTVLPSTVIASRDWYYGNVSVAPEAVALHHGAATWLSEEERALRERQHALVRRFGRRLGGLLANGHRGAQYLKIHGFSATLRKMRGGI